MFEHKLASLTVLSALAFSAVVTGCGGGASSDSDPESPTPGVEKSAAAALQVDKADGDDIEMSAVVGGDRFQIVSRVETADAPDAEEEDEAASEPSRTRHITVRGSDGVVYGDLSIDLASRDVVGSLASASFGQADDADTDTSPEHWAPLADSRAGQLVRAIATSASALASKDDAPDVSETLTQLSRMRDRLDVMSGRASAAPDLGSTDMHLDGACVTPQDGHAFVYVSTPFVPIILSLRGRRNWAGAMRDVSGDYVGVVIYEGHLTHINPNRYKWTYHSTAHHGNGLALVHTQFHDVCARAKGFYPGTSYVKWGRIDCEPISN